jgi:hypothetical protein
MAKVLRTAKSFTHVSIDLIVIEQIFNGTKMAPKK